MECCCIKTGENTYSQGTAEEGGHILKNRLALWQAFQNCRGRIENFLGEGFSLYE